MKRFTAALLVVLALAAFAPAAALAHGGNFEAVHTETVTAGPYKLTLEFDAWPVRQEKNLQITVHPNTPLESIQAWVTITPGPGVKGKEIKNMKLMRYPGMTDGWMMQFPGIFGAGRWDWKFRVEGSQGPAEGQLSLRSDEAPPFPQWLGWAIGLVPLWGMIWFGVREARRVRRLVAAEAIR